MHLRILLILVLGARTLGAQIPSTEYAQRREALAARIDSGVILAVGAREPIAHYPAFAQLPAFQYLTGHAAPDAALVLVKRGGRVSGVLLVPPTDPRGVLYTGRATDIPMIARRTGLTVRDASALVPLLDSLAGLGLPLYTVADIRSGDFARSDTITLGRTLASVLRERHPALVVHDATAMVDALRARKSAAELALLREAVRISDDAHREAMRMIAPGVKENEIQATVEYTFRRLGGDGPAYASIVGSGPNSTTLHYDAGDRAAQTGEVVLMDVAAAYMGYAADITRTVPANGIFSADQRAIYEIVLAAQKAAERAVRPGAARGDVMDSSRAVIKAGLARLGLVESPDAGFDAPPGFCPTRGFRREGEPCPQWYLYSYHGYMHGLGLDVHDPAQFSSVEPFTFQVGDAFTIEPGLYVRPNALEGLPDTPRNGAMIARVRAAVERYKGTGVRIEDDYFVTPTGVERVSGAPREIAEIEALMRRPRPAT